MCRIRPPAARGTREEIDHDDDHDQQRMAVRSFVYFGIDGKSATRLLRNVSRTKETSHVCQVNNTPTSYPFAHDSNDRDGRCGLIGSRGQHNVDWRRISGLG